MKKRWSANTWLLIVLVTVIGLVGIDIGRRMFAGPVVEPPPPPQGGPPDFKVGDKAPDFALPGEDGKERRLHDVVKGDTILTFSCGCNKCKLYQTFLGKLLTRLGSNRPDVVSINTTKPEASEAWARDTRVKQTFLYAESHDIDVLKPYHGHPCPRAFRLARDGTVKWIGASPSQAPGAPAMGEELAQELGFRRPDGGDKTRPVMPQMDWEKL
jgi:peroxiredoxin